MEKRHPSKMWIGGSNPLCDNVKFKIKTSHEQIIFENTNECFVKKYKSTYK